MSFVSTLSSPDTSQCFQDAVAEASEADPLSKLLGVVRSPTQLITSVRSNSFSRVAAGNSIGVVHLLANPVSARFGRAPGGELATTFVNLMCAVRRVAGWSEHAITDLSYAYTHWKECRTAMFLSELQGAIDASIAAVLNSPARVIVAYGNNVRDTLTDERLLQLGATRGPVTTVANRVSYCLLTITVAATTRHFWLVDTVHPSYHGRAGRIYAAVELAEQLMSKQFPTPVQRAAVAAGNEEAVDLTGGDEDGTEEKEDGQTAAVSAAVWGAIREAADYFGIDDLDGDDDEECDVAEAE